MRPKNAKKKNKLKSDFVYYNFGQVNNKYYILDLDSADQSRTQVLNKAEE